MDWNFSGIKESADGASNADAGTKVGIDQITPAIRTSQMLITFQRGKSSMGQRFLSYRNQSFAGLAEESTTSVSVDLTTLTFTPVAISTSA